MDLEQFIRESLVQVAKGIKGANQELAGTSAEVNPPNIRPVSKDMQIYGVLSQHQNKRVVHLIEFDVAVFASEEKEKKGGLGVAVATIGFGAQGKSQVGTSAESRLRFSIPMVFPEH